MSQFMQRALELAKFGRPSPNPYVGCVIVKHGRIIGEGFHKKAGEEHAEIAALKKAKDAKDAVLYVTLEPCCHHGRTGPCTEAIIAAGIKKAVIAMPDPNPLVDGRGMQALKKAGIEVILEDEKEAARMNEFYIKYIAQKLPFIALKAAMSLDGKIAANDGSSMWISNAASRNHVHELRNRYDAVMTAASTVIKDNPKLTCRLPDGRNPLRIVVDSKLRIPLNANVLADDNVIVATTEMAEKQKLIDIKGLGAKIIITGEKGGKVDLVELMRKLAALEITSILVEAGGNLAAALLENKLVDKCIFFIAPKLIGGEHAMTPVEGMGSAGIGQATALKRVSFRQFDDDIMVEGYVE